MDAKDFFYDFGRALYRIDAVYDEFAKACGVPPTLLWILYALNDGTPHTQREICADWALPKSTVNMTITQLKQDGYVMLAPIKGKRREMTVILTDSGKRYAENILSELYARENKAFDKLTADERRLISCMEKLTELLK